MFPYSSDEINNFRSSKVKTFTEFISKNDTYLPEESKNKIYGVIDNLKFRRDASRKDIVNQLFEKGINYQIAAEIASNAMHDCQNRRVALLIFNNLFKNGKGFDKAIYTATEEMLNNCADESYDAKAFLLFKKLFHYREGYEEAAIIIEKLLNPLDYSHPNALKVRGLQFLLDLIDEEEEYLVNCERVPEDLDSCLQTVLPFVLTLIKQRKLCFKNETAMLLVSIFKRIFKEGKGFKIAAKLAEENFPSQIFTSLKWQYTNDKDCLNNNTLTTASIDLFNELVQNGKEIEKAQHVIQYYLHEFTFKPSVISLVKTLMKQGLETIIAIDFAKQLERSDCGLWIWERLFEKGEAYKEAFAYAKSQLLNTDGLSQLAICILENLCSYRQQLDEIEKYINTNLEDQRISKLLKPIVKNFNIARQYIPTKSARSRMEIEG